MAHYTERPREELVRCDSFEIAWSPLRQPMDLLRAAGLQMVVEVLEEALPDLAPEDNVFRLAVTCLRAMEGAATADPTHAAMKPRHEWGTQNVWLPVTYFCLWMCRLMGWMPELGHCVVCGLELEEAWWSAGADGVTCADDRRPGSVRLTREAVAEIRRIFRARLADVAAEAWPESRVKLPLQFGVGLLERNLDRRIRSAAVLRNAL
jgi:DNA repair protein RecO (recombination protein O)